MKYTPPLLSLREKVQTREDFERLLACHASDQDRRVQLHPSKLADQEFAEAFNNFPPELPAHAGITSWFSWAGRVAIFQIAKDRRIDNDIDKYILRIRELNLGYFRANHAPTTGELGDFEPFAQEVLTHPHSQFGLEMRTMPPDQSPLIACRLKHTPPTGEADSRIHQFSLAPHIAASALWLAGTFMIKERAA